MNQSKTPLFDRLVHHDEEGPVSFHVPGHKYGAVFPENGQQYFRNILKLDATELTGLDDLHSAEGVILESENLLSDLYGSQKSFFLINGSTVGNLSMILSILTEGDVVLVQRNSHKSITNGLKLAKARPVFLRPDYDPVAMVAGGVSVETVKSAIRQHPDAKALILTYPNYYGMTCDLKRIIEFAHAHRLPVLVDEAHGVHFVAGDAFPASAVELGADVVVQSAHKTLPAMTMGAFLHYQSNLIALGNLKFYLQALQSSSPSYPLMASLDLARSYLGTYEKEDLEYLLGEIEAFFTVVKHLKGIRVLKQADPLKLIIQSTGAWTGYELQRELEAEGIFTELADPFNVLFVFPLLKRGMKHPFMVTAEKIAKVSTRIPDKKGKQEYPLNDNAISTLAVTYQEMDDLEMETIELKKAVGRISAEDIIPYPPGIPLCLRGEVLSQEYVEIIMSLREIGAKIQGADQLQAGKITVFRSLED